MPFSFYVGIQCSQQTTSSPVFLLQICYWSWCNKASLYVYIWKMIGMCSPGEFVQVKLLSRVRRGVQILADESTSTFESFAPSTSELLGSPPGQAVTYQAAGSSSPMWRACYLLIVMTWNSRSTDKTERLHVCPWALLVSLPCILMLSSTH